MIASVSVVATVRPCPPRAWSAWPWVTRALATGCEGSIQQSAGTTWMPCGSGRIQANGAVIPGRMARSGAEFQPSPLLLGREAPGAVAIDEFAAEPPAQAERRGAGEAD